VRPRARRSSPTCRAHVHVGAAVRSSVAAPAPAARPPRAACAPGPRVTCRQSSTAHNRSASKVCAQTSTASPTGPLLSASVRPSSSTATAASECLCTSTPITIIRLASNQKKERPASGQTSIEAKATLLSGHARRSREGGGDTTLASQPPGRHAGIESAAANPNSQTPTRQHTPTVTLSSGMSPEAEPPANENDHSASSVGSSPASSSRLVACET
jgi:hypothetical protein